MPAEQVYNEQLRRNTLYLYLRMGIGTLISLYTSRIVLEQLGVEDFGVFTVVASVVATLNFMSNSMSGAISRFFAFELGQKNEKRLTELFNATIRIELLLSIVLGIGILIVGKWFIDNELDIPSNRIDAANIVLWWTTCSFVITLLVLPFKGAVVANEKFGFYAIIELIFVILKLGGVLLLKYFSAEKLIIYAVVIFIATLLNGVGYVIYSMTRFRECRFMARTLKSQYSELTKYVSADLFGNFCGIASFQSLQWIVNIFFGVMLNTAMGIATQVSGAVSSFVSNTAQVVRPQIIKEYSVRNLKKVEELIIWGNNYIILLMSLFLIPLLINIRYVLFLWLGEVPIETAQFCEFALLAAFAASLTTISNCVVQATGKIKGLSITNGILHLLTPIISYLLFYYLELEAYFTYVLNFILIFVLWFNALRYIHLYIPEINITGIILKSLRSIIFISIVYIFVQYMSSYVENSFVKLVATIILTLVLVVLPLIITKSKKDLYINS